jgi:hypothetical protein
MRIFFGCIHTPAETVELGRHTPGKFHIRSLERIGHPETSLTATGKKPGKSCGKTRDRPIERSTGAHSEGDWLEIEYGSVFLSRLHSDPN